MSAYQLIHHCIVFHRPDIESLSMGTVVEWCVAVLVFDEGVTAALLEHFYHVLTVGVSGRIVQGSSAGL